MVPVVAEERHQPEEEACFDGNLSYAMLCVTLRRLSFSGSVKWSGVERDDTGQADMWEFAISRVFRFRCSSSGRHEVLVC